MRKPLYVADSYVQTKFRGMNHALMPVMINRTSIRITHIMTIIVLISSRKQFMSQALVNVQRH